METIVKFSVVLDIVKEARRRGIPAVGARLGGQFHRSPIASHFVCVRCAGTYFERF